MLYSFAFGQVEHCAFHTHLLSTYLRQLEVGVIVVAQRFCTADSIDIIVSQILSVRRVFKVGEQVEVLRYDVMFLTRRHLGLCRQQLSRMRAFNKWLVAGDDWFDSVMSLGCGVAGLMCRLICGNSPVR